MKKSQEADPNYSPKFVVPKSVSAIKDDVMADLASKGVTAPYKSSELSRPQLPRYITKITREALGELLAAYAKYLRHLSWKAGEAAFELEVAKKHVRKVKADVMSAIQHSTGTDKVTFVEKEVEKDVLVLEATDFELAAYGRHKMLTATIKGVEEEFATVSREISRRDGDRPIGTRLSNVQGAKGMGGISGG